ncbi:MAG: GxxExxY protein [Pseudomonadota bacterium]
MTSAQSRNSTRLARRTAPALPEEVLRDRLTAEVVDSALAVRSALGPFYDVTVYRNALVVELRRRAVRCQKNVALSVAFRGEVVGSYMADVLVDDALLVKVMAQGHLDVRFKDHVLQGLGAAGVRLGLLFDFGGSELTFCRIL